MIKFSDDYKIRAKIFKALGHPARLFIVELLDDDKQYCVNDITKLIGTDTSTVSRHLSVLKNSGIVGCEKRGLYVYYFLKIKCVNSFFVCVNEVIKGRRGE
ncbi:MAG: metalloregulator ArsR/SmtB family transcription factor [Candidatus Muirbacterium halophilum]|nr:metalloregulator ArsR/SmtB family transcription factor [Candidatus Muirbacterium halophilum]MCK9474321.1 metalloregulator ArsR/SmtB family transcription factor [Candidatus Muirbacterium halophilum]